MREQEIHNRPANGRCPSNVERFIKITFEKLPPDTKVLVALFAALNNAASLTHDFELPDRLWEAVRFGNGGPLVGESEEVNWLKGICDGLLLLTEHA